MLLCDEATSALDPLIERSVVEVIDRASRNVTTDGDKRTSSVSGLGLALVGPPHPTCSFVVSVHHRCSPPL